LAQQNDAQQRANTSPISLSQQCFAGRQGQTMADAQFLSRADIAVCALIVLVLLSGG
jgi:predicted metalloprotease